jgi:histone-binding protein RBBP4
MRVWAGEEVKIDERELESDGMEGVESTVTGASAKAGSAKASRGVSEADD